MIHFISNLSTAANILHMKIIENEIHIHIVLVESVMFQNVVFLNTPMHIDIYHIPVSYYTFIYITLQSINIEHTVVKNFPFMFLCYTSSAIVYMYIELATYALIKSILYNIVPVPMCYNINENDGMKYNGNEG